jgi:DNA-binding MurR/RpiR family transcriptional regulator
MDTLPEGISTRSRGKSSAQGLRSAIITLEREHFDKCLDRFENDDSFIQASAMIVSARRRYITAAASSEAFSRLLHRNLDSGLVNVMEVESSSMSAIDLLSDVRKQDVLIAYSFMRYPQSTILLAKNWVAEGGQLVLITDDRNSPAAQYADVTIDVGSEGMVYLPSPTATSLATFILSNLVIASSKGAKRHLAARERASRGLGYFTGQDPLRSQYTDILPDD